MRISSIEVTGVGGGNQPMQALAEEEEAEIEKEQNPVDAEEDNVIVREDTLDMSKHHTNTKTGRCSLYI